MRTIDTRNNLQIAILVEMLEDVSRATRPEEASTSFSRRIGKLRQTDAFIGVSVRHTPPGEYKITRYFHDGQIAGRNEGLGADDPWREWDSIATQQGGFIGTLIADPEPKLIHDLSIANDPVLGDRLKEMGSCMAIPLFDGGKVLNWSIHFRRAATGYSLAELGDFLLTNNLFGAMTRNLVNLDQVRTLNQRLREQFEQIARVQQALLPSSVPEIPGVAIATSYLTSDQAGGDYYDFFDLGKDRWGFLVADVSGHGAGAATVMAMLHGILHAYPDLSCGPAAALRFANKRLCAASAESSFTTAVFGVLDANSRELTVARAGHPHPLIKQRSGVDLLDGPSSLPLGIDDTTEFEQHSTRFEQGQTLVLYTDGITEVFDQRRRMFGLEGIRGAVKGSSGKADDVVDAIHTALYAHSGLRTREDDQTLVVMHAE